MSNSMSSPHFFSLSRDTSRVEDSFVVVEVQQPTPPSVSNGLGIVLHTRRTSNPTCACGYDCAAVSVVVFGGVSIATTASCCELSSASCGRAHSRLRAWIGGRASFSTTRTHFPIDDGSVQVETTDLVTVTRCTRTTTHSTGGIPPQRSHQGRSHSYHSDRYYNYRYNRNQHASAVIRITAAVNAPLRVGFARHCGRL
jgi:hypothetical protein